MSPMLVLLEKIRRSPGMYLGCPSLARLPFFLRGYDLALQEHETEPSPRFLPHFRDWVQQRFQSTTRGWEELIRDHGRDDAEAFDRFWSLLDEFLEEQARNADNGAASSPKSGQAQIPFAGPTAKG